MLDSGPKALRKPAQGKRGTSAALGIAFKKDKALKGRDKLCRPSGLGSFLSRIPGRRPLRRGLALGWLVSGLWPGVRAFAEVHDRLQRARHPSIHLTAERGATHTARVPNTAYNVLQP